MEKQTFERFSRIVYEASGIVLPPEKQSLLSSRIQRRLKELALKNESEYLKIIELDVEGTELARLVDAVSTNVTYFYREAGHFDTYREILRSLKNEGRTKIKVWCAAASSGEEPYTLAFEASRALDLKKQEFKLLATDICSEVLHKAIAGEYRSDVVDKIPREIRNQFMEIAADSNAGSWIVKDNIKQLVLFKKLNLVNFPYSLKGPLDIIFCRNVMIYFDVKTRDRIVKEFSRLLSKGGYLFLSHSENLLGIEHDFEKVGASVFRKRA